jgi:hypothetical protein
MCSRTGICFLGAGIFALTQNREIRFIIVNQILRRSTDIRNQSIQKIERHAFADHDAKDLDAVFVGRERVVGDDVLLCAEELGDGILFQMREFLLELV